MSFPSRDERNKCWGARDEYWQCLDKHGVKESSDTGPCAELRKLYEQSCSSQWVKHFDRKRSYLQFKEKIEKEGIPNRSSDTVKTAVFEKRRVYHTICHL